MRRATTALFVDTSYIVALFNPRDIHHQRALEIAETIADSQTPLMTTDAIFIEVLDGLSKLSTRKLAFRVIHELQQDSEIEMIPINSMLLNQATALYLARMDKEWGLTDCISFIVMQQRGITRALTTDHHFEQAGFQVLL